MLTPRRDKLVASSRKKARDRTLATRWLPRKIPRRDVARQICLQRVEVALRCGEMSSNATHARPVVAAKAPAKKNEFRSRASTTPGEPAASVSESGPDRRSRTCLVSGRAGSRRGVAAARGAVVLGGTWVRARSINARGSCEIRNCRWSSPSRTTATSERRAPRGYASRMDAHEGAERCNSRVAGERSAASSSRTSSALSARGA